jgi:hypothetical protein
LIDDTPHIVIECLKFKDSWGLALERLQKLKDIHACVSEWKLHSGERRLHVLKEPWLSLFFFAVASLLQGLSMAFLCFCCNASKDFVLAPAAWNFVTAESVLVISW